MKTHNAAKISKGQEQKRGKTEIGVFGNKNKTLGSTVAPRNIELRVAKVPELMKIPISTPSRRESRNFADAKVSQNQNLPFAQTLALRTMPFTLLSYLVAA
jgi:hypothetical protein